MTQSKPKFGCFGCFWIMALLAFSVIQVGIILWLNPQWLDDNAFWKEPVYPPEFVISPLSIDEIEKDIPSPRKDPESKVTLWEEFARTARYTIDKGARARTIEGTTIDFPARSIRSDTAITVTPVTRVPSEMVTAGAVPIGPLHDIRIGNEDHYRFDRPARISIPYDPTLLPKDVTPDQLAIGTWEGNRWRALPSQIDYQAQTISANLEHASIEGVIAITALLGVAAGRYTETGRGLYEMAKRRLGHTYKTRCFSIHYGTDVGLGVPPDNEYPLAAGRSSGDHPLFVVDIGNHLEEARAGLHKVGMPLSVPLAIRWDVFLVPLKDFGASDLGGPVMLDNDFRRNGAFPADLGYRLRSTCVHELIHVAQDQYFSFNTAGKIRWWIESTAEYLSTRYLQLNGEATPGSQYYVTANPAFLATPYDRAEGLLPYAYGSFFEWMDKQGIDGVKVIQTVNNSGDANLPALNTAIRAHSPDRSLGDLFMDFAEDMYHKNLWSGQLIPLGAVNAQFNTPNGFNTLLRATSANGGNMYVYSKRQVAMKHLSAEFFSIKGDPFPVESQAKLVLRVGGGSPPNSHFAMVSEYRMRGGYPPAASATPLLPMIIWDQPETFHLSHRLASPPEISNDINAFSLVLANTSPSNDGPGLTIERWILMPPESVNFNKTESKSYEVNWPQSILREKASQLFQGYNVYRRLKGDDRFPSTPLNPTPLTEENYEDFPEEDEDYDYTVTVVDKFDNESLHAPIEEIDPFQGEWKGKVVLVEGDLTDPVARAFQKSEQETEARWREEEQNAPTPEARQRLVQRHNERREDARILKEKIMELLDKLEELTRLGVPVTFKVRRSDGKYFMRLTHLYFKSIETEDDEEVPMKRMGRYSITTVEQEEDVPPLILALHRPDEINTVYEVDVPTEEGNLHYGIRFALKRTQKPN